MASKTMSTRPHVRSTEQVYSLISRGHCWHFDAWMLRHPASGMLYVKVQQRKGGRDLLAEHEYIYEGGRLRYVPRIPTECEPVTMQDQREWPQFAELNALHWRYIIPMTHRIPAGFRSRSVALHYVRAPSLAPFEGDEVNLHQYAEK
jgi:hypothetical protein